MPEPTLSAGIADFQPKVLLIDSYDSFSYNVAALCRKAIPGCQIHIIKNDQLILSQVISNIDHFAAIIVGPGPGSPTEPFSIGIINEIWNTVNIPIFGVCLGLQSLAFCHGAEIRRLKVVKHGITSSISHTGTSIFAHLGPVVAVRYHSLHAHIKQSGTSSLEVLAWCHDDGEDEDIIMALRHRTKPFWAVQYHPESVCTESGGADVVRNFWDLALQWNSMHRQISPAPWTPELTELFGEPWPKITLTPRESLPSTRKVSFISLDLPKLGVLDIFDFVKIKERFAPALLDSAAKPGRWSIIGAVTESTSRIRYVAGNSFLEINERKVHLTPNTSIWSWLSMHMKQHKAEDGLSEIPFWGGFIGTISYEQGVHDLGVKLQRMAPKCPDINLLFIERSIIRDEVTGRIYVQSIIENDHAWLQTTADGLLSHQRRQLCKEEYIQQRATTIARPSRESYTSKVKLAQASLHAGDSYEICLTASTRITVPPHAKRMTSWERYMRLRTTNPAARAAFLVLSPVTLLAASPERFVSVSRESKPTVQKCPIKGTLRKQGLETTREVAEHTLKGSVKEVAENLMIVDLIRHDLHSVVGENVTVKKFCSVEESETLWSLVSVIEGSRSHDNADTSSSIDLGWEVLSKSLPPGSMSGAPKKRSVEILQTLEDNERGIYSGVFGYACVGGGCDWAVMIRSAYKIGNQSADEDEEWIIGAGGAITALSDPDAEYEEMLTKLQSASRAFT